MRLKLLTLTLMLPTALVLAGECCAQGRGVQTLFGSETRVRRPARLPGAVIKQIMAAADEGQRYCLEHYEGNPAGDLAGSHVDINADQIPDLIAQGVGGCFIGAHSTTFYVFSKAETRLAPGFDLVLTTPADYLEVKRVVSNGYRDIETGYHTALEMYSTVWKFDGSKYQPRECFIEEFKTRRRQRTTCNAEE